MHFINDTNYSYWEVKQYFRLFDLIVVGSGIVGLSTAIAFKKKHPKAEILILERGRMPDGASTKNAGFACFGTVGELLDDLSSMPETAVWETVAMRWKGLQILRRRLKDKNIDFRPYGGFELFDERREYLHCKEHVDILNRQMKRVLGIKDCYKDAPTAASRFKGVQGVIRNTYEGQIDTALMMRNLRQLALSLGIDLLNSVQVSEISDTGSGAALQSNVGVFNARKVVVATNGFAASLLGLEEVKPARAQVLITRPIPGLKLKGSFHFFKGFYYFRNIDGRILFGGGRNLDIEGETTSEQGLNLQIQSQLDKLLRTMILPGMPVEIEHRWSGIMGVGMEKKPIVRKTGKNILAAVRMGGMGIAIGSLVGELAAAEIA